MRAKRRGVFITGGVYAIATLNFIPEIFVDGAGLVVDFELAESWHAEEEVLIVDETLVLWQALVVVPHLPIHTTEKGPLSELKKLRRTKRSRSMDLKALQRT